MQAWPFDTIQRPACFKLRQDVGSSKLAPCWSDMVLKQSCWRIVITSVITEMGQEQWITWVWLSRAMGKGSGY